MLPMSNRNPLRKIWKWLTRAYHYEYEVVRPFTAVATLSGEQRQFKPGERFVCPSRQDQPSVMIEFESAFYLVERSAFETCCHVRKPTTAPWA
jgi:hypothetical protein